MAEPICSSPEGGSIVSKESRISVVMASYNYERYIEESVKSVWDQSYPNLELVIVDDASTDATLAILKELEKRSPIGMTIDCNKANQGLNRTQNLAVGLARGDLIAFLASDDKYAPDRFKSQVDLFKRDLHLMVVYGNGWSFRGRDLTARLHSDDVKRLLSQDADLVLRYLYTHSSPFYLQTALVRKEFLLECGGNDEQVLADDWVLNIRFFQALVKAGHFDYIDEDLAYYRLHDDNLHKNFARQIALKKEVIEKYTPKSLKREALANIYRKQAGIALVHGDLLNGMSFLFLSKVNALLSKRSFKDAMKAVTDMAWLESVSCALGCPPNDEEILLGRDRLHALPGNFRIVRCRTCGLMRTNPRPTLDAMESYYPEDYGPYESTKVNPSKVPPTRKKRFLKLLDTDTRKTPQLPPGRMLEIGCA